jgi:hypothetical protein
MRRFFTVVVLVVVLPIVDGLHILSYNFVSLGFMKTIHILLVSMEDYTHIV